MTFDEVSLDQQGTVAKRASRKLVAQDALRTQFPPVLLRMRLDAELSSRWADGHVSAATLWEDFAKYIYLPRLRDQDVLLATVQAGPASTVWQMEGFATAVGSDERSGRYLELAAGSHPGTLTLTALVVRPEFALGQLEADEERSEEADGTVGTGTAASERVTTSTAATGGAEPGPRTAPKAAVFRGSVTLDPTRPVKGFGDVSKEVLDHLASQVGAEVEVRVEIVARKPDGFPDQTVRTVTENANTLRFHQDTGFSED